MINFSTNFQNVLWTPSRMIDRLGKEIDHPDSIYFWAHKVSNMFIYGPCREKTCLLEVANNKGPDQPAHSHSLISAFVIRLLKSIISRLATTSEISTF